MPEEAVVDERRESVDARTGDCLGTFECAASGEDAEAEEIALFVGG